MGGAEPRQQRERGQKKSSRTNHGNKQTKSIIVECAWAASRKKESFISARYKRLAARRGKKRALIAVGHQLLKIVYHVLKNQTQYNELGDTYIDARKRASQIRYYQEALKRLGAGEPETLSA